LKIVVTGQKNPASTADTVVVDAIDLHAANDAPTGAVQFNDVTALQPGDYTVQITYLNWDATDRYCYFSVNGTAPIKLAFPPSGGTGSTNVATVRIHLDPGEPGNTLRFFNDDAAAPNIDKISVPNPVR
jgi:alpha-galactosidase